MPTFVILLLLVLAALTIGSKFLLMRSLSRVRCPFCERRFGLIAALQNKIVVRIDHVSWDESAPLFTRGVDYMHVREVRCRHCQNLSRVDAEGNKGTEFSECDNDDDIACCARVCDRL